MTTLQKLKADLLSKTVQHPLASHPQHVIRVSSKIRYMPLVTAQLVKVSSPHVHPQLCPNAIKKDSYGSHKLFFKLNYGEESQNSQVPFNKRFAGNLTFLMPRVHVSRLMWASQPVGLLGQRLILGDLYPSELAFAQQ